MCQRANSQAVSFQIWTGEETLNPVGSMSMTFPLREVARELSEFVMMQAATTMVQETHKTADYTSTTRRETTMTTDIRYDFVDDVSCRNPVLSIPITPTLRLSAVVWTAHVVDTVLNARLECLDYALRRLTSSLPDDEVWLIAAHETLQQDNRITRHNGLWKSLQKAGVDIPQGEFVGESVLPSEGGIRVFDAVRCGLDQLKAIHAVTIAAQTALVVIPKNQAKEAVKLLVQKGWAMTNSKPPEEVLEFVCAQSGLVLEVYGDFDDPEVSVAAIGRKERLRNLDLG